MGSEMCIRDRDCCLLLVAQSTRLMLPTIVSRCQVIRFPPLSASEIAAALVERKGVTPARADSIARLAFGSYTRAVELLEGDATRALEASLEFLRAAVVGDALKISAVVEEWSDSGSRQSVHERLKYVTVWLRDALTWKTVAPKEASERIAVVGYEEVIGRIAARYDAGRIVNAWNAVEEADIAVDLNANLPLLLTALALKIRWIMS